MSTFELKPGQWLYASCSAEWYGPILRVGKDDNGGDVIDLPVSDINEFLDEGERFGAEHQKESPNICRFTKAESHEPVGGVLRDLQYKLDGELGGTRFVRLNTPGNGCYRCQELFSIHDERRLE